jgi:hypothetical protein
MSRPRDAGERHEGPRSIVRETYEARETYDVRDDATQPDDGVICKRGNYTKPVSRPQTDRVHL